MNNITTFRNQIKEIEIDGYKFKVTQLSVYDLYSKAQEEYKKNRLKDSMIVAEYLTGKEKSDFLQEVLRSIPTGEELAIELDKYLKSADGILMILKYVISKNNPELTLEDLNNIIQPNTIDKYTSIYTYAFSGVEEHEMDKSISVDEGDSFDSLAKKNLTV